MNRLSIQRRTAIIAALVEGNSVRATCRLTGSAKGTVLRLLKEIGTACAAHHNIAVRRVRCRLIQCDEIWSFCYAKDRNVPQRLKGQPGHGSVWTWTALDPHSKLIVSWLVGDREPESVRDFLIDLRKRLATRVQLTTDGYKPYFLAVPNAFGMGVDFGRVLKHYDSRGHYVGSTKKAVLGHPRPEHISTSHVERHNLSMRMGMRRFTRKTNAFSKKLENLKHAVALYFTHYNFCRLHQATDQTPAQCAGLTDSRWSLADLVGLLDGEPSK